MKVGVINYGAGNISNVLRALRDIDFSHIVVNTPDQLLIVDKIIMPGVGAFGSAMAHLKSSGLADVIRSSAKSGTPILGICLGMQMLFETSSEFETNAGLGIIDGDVVDMTPKDVPIPHIGWSPVFTRDVRVLCSSHDIDSTRYLYFAHSMVCRANDDKIVTMGLHYGGALITAAIEKENIFGTQFHPELSGLEGREILMNFLSI